MMSSTPVPPRPLQPEIPVFTRFPLAHIFDCSISKTYFDYPSGSFDYIHFHFNFPKSSGSCKTRFLHNRLLDEYGIVRSFEGFISYVQ